ncbi:MAG: hypothetical protein ACOZE5_17370 [Verrucomicrobiota bacterium]
MIPSSFPASYLFWVKVEILKNYCALYQRPNEDVCAEQIPLANQFPYRWRDAQCLRDNETGHLLMIRERFTMGGWCREEFCSIAEQMI